jgi:hypothetical protein
LHDNPLHQTALYIGVPADVLAAAGVLIAKRQYKRMGMKQSKVYKIYNPIVVNEHGGVLPMVSSFFEGLISEDTDPDNSTFFMFFSIVIFIFSVIWGVIGFVAGFFQYDDHLKIAYSLVSKYNLSQHTRFYLLHMINMTFFASPIGFIFGYIFGYRSVYRYDISIFLLMVRGFFWGVTGSIGLMLIVLFIMATAGYLWAYTPVYIRLFYRVIFSIFVGASYFCITWCILETMRLIIRKSLRFLLRD